MHRLPGSLTCALLLTLPALVGWQGGGRGTALWAQGEGGRMIDQDEILADAVGLFSSDGEARVLLTLSLPGSEGDGVLSVRLPIALAQQRDGVDADHPEVRVQYVEYSRSGDPAFRSDQAVEGFVRIAGAVFEDGQAIVALDLEVASGGRWRRVDVPRVVVRPAVVESGGGSVGSESVDGEAWSGCGSTWEDDDEDYVDEDTGCGGDDVSESYGSTEPETSGCAGDGIDSSSSDSGSGCDSCEGDAIASPSPRRRRPRSSWAARVVRWLPYGFIFLSIHLLRTRRRRRT